MKSMRRKKPAPPTLRDVKGPIVRIGGPVDASKVTLRIFGDELDPGEISKRLGHRPTTGRRKGDVIPDRRYHRVAPTGCWLLECKGDERAPLEKKIRNLLSKLNPDVSVWATLKRMYQVDLFCGVFLRGWNRGFNLSPELLKLLAERRLKIDFDIYGP